jgi:ELWxxDGT repeat protein
MKTRTLFISLIVLLLVKPLAIANDEAGGETTTNNQGRTITDISSERFSAYMTAIRAKGLKVDFGSVDTRAKTGSWARSDISSSPGPLKKGFSQANALNARSIYHFHASNSAPGELRYSAPNVAQGLHFDFDSTGLRVVPHPSIDRPSEKDRTGLTPNEVCDPPAVPSNKSSESWDLTLRLAGYGRGAAVHLAKQTIPSAEKSKVAYERNDITEWYVNGPSGLEQGFTVHSRPKAMGKPSNNAEKEPLRIEIELKTDLIPILLPDRQGLKFHQEQKKLPVLSYDELHVFDARGAEIPAQFELIPSVNDTGHSKLAILVDDHEASYPIVVDPILNVEIVKDINQTTRGTGFDEWQWVVISDVIFFKASVDEYGWELWKSDGTEEGTVMVKDIRPGPDPSDPNGMTVMGDTLYFSAKDGIHGNELWTSDGT